MSSVFGPFYVPFLICLACHGALGEMPSDERLEAFLSKSKTYVTGSAQVKAYEKNALKEALNVAISNKGRAAFTSVLDSHWDKEATLSEKKKWLLEATEAAKKAGNDIVSFYLDGKTKSGKNWSVFAINRMEMPYDAATYLWFERNQFMKEGEINYKAFDFSGEKDSVVAADPIAWADNEFKGTPKTRAERRRVLAEQAEAQKRDWEARMKNAASLPPTHTYIPYQTCGSPSAQVGSLRPEANGMR